MEHLPFVDYQAWPQLNGSVLVHALKSWKQFKFVRERGFKPKTDTRVGSALHSMVEMLPVETFHDLFVVMPDFANHPDNVTNGRELKDGTITGQKPSTSVSTNWCKDQIKQFREQNQGREVLDRKQFARCQRMLESIQATPEAMRLIESSVKEVSIAATINGVECKGRIDGFAGNTLWDLKSTPNISPSAFGRIAANLHYPLKMALYRRLLAAKGVHVRAAKFIAVQDSKPHRDGYTYNDAPDCCVVNVPLQVLDNEDERLDWLLSGYSDCERTGEWPGIPNHELVVPNWAMPAEESTVEWGAIE